MSTTDSDELEEVEDLDDEFGEEGFVEPEDPDIADLWSPLVYRTARGAQAAVLLAFFVAVGFGVTGRGPFAALEDASDWARSTSTQELGSNHPVQVLAVSDCVAMNNRPSGAVELKT